MLRHMLWEHVVVLVSDVVVEGLLAVLDKRMEGSAWLMGDDYSIADIATWPWVRNLYGFYGAGELVGIQDFPNVTRTVDAFVARPAVIRGLAIPAAPG